MTSIPAGIPSADGSDSNTGLPRTESSGEGNVCGPLFVCERWWMLSESFRERRASPMVPDMRTPPSSHPRAGDSIRTRTGAPGSRAEYCPRATHCKSRNRFPRLWRSPHEAGDQATRCRRNRGTPGCPRAPRAVRGRCSAHHQLLDCSVYGRSTRRWLEPRMRSARPWRSRVIRHPPRRREYGNPRWRGWTGDSLNPERGAAVQVDAGRTE